MSSAQKLIFNITHMKTFIKGLLSVAGVAYLLGLGVLAMRSNQAQPIQPLGDVNGIPFISVDVASSTTVLTTSKQILATSTAAQYRLFQNNGPFTIYLSFKNDAPATINNGIMLIASTSLELKGETLYLGAVSAIAAGGSSGLLVTQK